MSVPPFRSFRHPGESSNSTIFNGPRRRKRQNLRHGRICRPNGLFLRGDLSLSDSANSLFCTAVGGCSAQPDKAALARLSTTVRPRGLLQDIDPTVGERPARQFLLVLIKPSHYGDDGYVIRWWRTTIPSNSLAAVYGIASDCADRQVLGPDVVIDVDAMDETNTRIDV